MLGNLVICTTLRTVLFGLAILATAKPSYSERPDALEDLRLNQVQLVGSHNSSKGAIDPVLLKAMATIAPAAQALDYSHPPLTEQLNLGLRNLELDIYHDPNGGLFANPMGLAMVRKSGEIPRPFDPNDEMQKPGFKVLHVPDIDFRSNCLTLTQALKDLRDWSETNEEHHPVIITINLSDKRIALPGSVEPVLFDIAALDALDEQLLLELGQSNLIVPDEVRGKAKTLESAVLDSGWPRMGVLTGRFLFVLDDFGRIRDLYVSDHPSLRDRVMFTHSHPGTPEATVMIRNNALIESEAIRDLVRKGYLVRTRADSGTHEARAGDYSRFEAAKKSGAQIISTDFYLADHRLNPEYCIRFEKGVYLRMNPMTSKP